MAKFDDKKFYVMSHDEHDTPTYTHETMITPNEIYGYKVVGIIEENADHKIHLNRFLMKEVDVDSKYWLENGQLGGYYRIYDGPNSYTLEYIFRLTIEMAELIVKNKEHIIGVCAPEGVLFFIGTSYSVGDLKKFIVVKKEIDQAPNLPPTWKVG